MNIKKCQIPKQSLHRSHFLTYLVLRNRKLSPKLLTYWWDTLYIRKVLLLKVQKIYLAKLSH